MAQRSVRLSISCFKMKLLKHFYRKNQRTCIKTSDCYDGIHIQSSCHIRANSWFLYSSGQHLAFWDTNFKIPCMNANIKISLH